MAAVQQMRVDIPTILLAVVSAGVTMFAYYLVRVGSLQPDPDAALDAVLQVRSCAAALRARCLPITVVGMQIPTFDESFSQRTVGQCHRTGGWGEVCVYERICFDGATYLALDPWNRAPQVIFPLRDQV